MKGAMDIARLEEMIDELTSTFVPLEQAVHCAATTHEKATADYSATLEEADQVVTRLKSDKWSLQAAEAHHKKPVHLIPMHNIYLGKIHHW